MNHINKGHVLNMSLYVRRGIICVPDQHILHLYNLILLSPCQNSVNAWKQFVQPKVTQPFTHSNKIAKCSWIYKCWKILAYISSNLQRNYLYLAKVNHMFIYFIETNLYLTNELWYDRCWSAMGPLSNICQNEANWS